MRICRAQEGDEHPSTLISINSLAGLYRDIGKVGEAAALFEEDLRCQIARGDSEEAADSAANLLDLLREHGLEERLAAVQRVATQPKGRVTTAGLAKDVGVVASLLPDIFGVLARIESGMKPPPPLRNTSSPPAAHVPRRRPPPTAAAAAAARGFRFPRRRRGS